MSGRCFIDTNVLFYLIDQADATKHQRACDLLNKLAVARSGYVSQQVVNELAANLIKKLRLDPADVQSVCSRILGEFTLVQWTPDVLSEALTVSSEASLSFWDASILASAAKANCRTLYTEDLGVGQVIRGVRVVNPFAVR